MNGSLLSGLGIGWRAELALTIERRTDLRFVEILAEDFFGLDTLPAPLRNLRERGLALVPHGIGLSLGSAAPPDRDRLRQLARLAELANAPLVSEHLAFVRGGGHESGHLLPLPRTREMLDVVIANVREAQAQLPVPLALENIAALFDWPDAGMSEAEFLSEVLEATGAGLLLDVENLYANTCNLGVDPRRYLDTVPLARVAYVHVAGGIAEHGPQQRLYHDTHAHAVPAPVFALLDEVCARIPGCAVMLERDDRFPSDTVLNSELDRIARAQSSQRVPEVADAG